jgi:cytochrome c-type biogenesis protein CcmH/NrfG
MGWIIFLGLAVMVGGLLWWRGAMPRAALELTGAALLLGLAGYAWQGNPGFAGQPRQAAAAAQKLTADEEALATRAKMGRQFGNAQQWLVLADAFNSRGRHGEAANYLRNGIKEHPRDSDLWVGLGNALVLHANGVISPAAQFAFQRAADIAPEHPAPPFFFGLALAQSGQIDQARAVWQQLLDRSPKDAEWRADLEGRLAAINQMQPPITGDTGAARPPDGGSTEAEKP